MSKVANKKLWEASKKEAVERYSDDGLWNARVAQQAVRIYKKNGGTYTGPKTMNDLSTWTDQKWTYHPFDADNSGRYLPVYVWKKLTPKQVRLTNKNKRRAKVKRVPYEDFVKNAF